MRYECHDCGVLIDEIDTIMMFDARYGIAGAVDFVPVPLCDACYQKRKKEKKNEAQ